jgi:3'(2'), 5'-bisphosphate nucleotidase
MGPPTENSALPPINRRAAADLMGPLTRLVALAGSAILAVNRARMQVCGKADGSPVTEADLAADRVIADGLARLAPEIPALSEERAASVGPGRSKAFFLIDPLDGTREFVAGRNEFTVNLALVVNGTPYLGIIGAPALGLIWRGLVGVGAERLTTANGLGPAEPIRTRPFPLIGQPWIAAVSR